MHRWLVASESDLSFLQGMMRLAARNKANWFNQRFKLNLLNTLFSLAGDVVYLEVYHNIPDPMTIDEMKDMGYGCLWKLYEDNLIFNSCEKKIGTDLIKHIHLIQSFLDYQGSEVTINHEAIETLIRQP